MISIVSPVYDEEAGIEEFHRRLSACLEGLAADLDFEVVYVNDGSVDRSLELLREIVADDDRVRVVDLSRNFGHQIALSAGVDHAHGDAIVVIDSDLQDPPEVIPEMIERWRKGFKVVYGVRVSRSGETRFKLWTSKLYYGFIDRVSEVPLPRQAGDFRLLDRQVVDVLDQMPERNRYVRGMVAWVGFPQCAVEYERDPRYAGKTKYSLTKMIRLGLDGITSFSDRPLRLATEVGLAAGEQQRPRLRWRISRTSGNSFAQGMKSAARLFCSLLCVSMTALCLAANSKMAWACSRIASTTTRSTSGG
jgi:dolichol-phosphate mannosyltransferase